MFEQLSNTLSYATFKSAYDTLNIIDGLSEGELRAKAITSLGIYVVEYMTISQLVDWYAIEKMKT